MSIEEENKAIIRRHAEEVFNKGNLAIADEIISPDYVFHNPVADIKGPDGFKQMVESLRKAIPDLHYTMNDMIAEGDKVVAIATCTGTFTGEYMGIPPTGKSVNMTQAFLYTLKDGKEVDAVALHDMNVFFQQLGISLPSQ